jgi:hypothetical protein
MIVISEGDKKIGLTPKNNIQEKVSQIQSFWINKANRILIEHFVSKFKCSLKTDE